MATRSLIGIVNEDKTITAIYCHFDSYINHTGKILFEYYKDRSKITQLMKLGDISFLEKNLYPTTDLHDYVNPEKNVVVAYSRDRNETLKYSTFNDTHSFIKEKGNYSYLYLFTLDNKWTVTTDTSSDLVDLESLICEYTS